MMRAIRANNRAARRKRASSSMVALADAVGKRTPFVYLEYSSAPDFRAWNLALEQWQNDYYHWIMSGKTTPEPKTPKSIDHKKEAKRPFPSMAKAVAHLTALKLSICEDDEPYKGREPLRLVSGYTTVSGKEVIEETKDLANECSSMGREDASVRLTSQQRTFNVRFSEDLERVHAANDVLKARHRAVKAAMRSRRAVAGGVSTTTLDADRICNQLISDNYVSSTVSGG